MLPEPIFLDGINGGIPLTHSARFRCLPSTNGYNKGYYSAKLQTTLISLGYLQQCGGSYHSTSSGLSIYMPNGTLLDSPQLTQFQLLPISDRLLASTYFDSDPTRSAGSAFATHVNAEMRHRCDEVEVLLHRLGFPTDESLIADISGGKIPTYLTGFDVRLNRQLRGPCPHQLAGKARAPVAPSSTSPPATTIGGNVSFDLQSVLDPPPGGRTHEIFFYDEFSGLFGHELCYSKNQADVLEAITSFIAKNFTIYGHKVTELHGDKERINESLRTPLAKLGIKVSLSLPGQHARFVERCVETVRSRCASVLSRLPYGLPLKYTPLLHSAVVKLLNNSINTRSAPMTPFEIVAGSKYTPKSLPFTFGSCHLVTMAQDKRQRYATRVGTQYRYAPKIEVGVCLGPCAVTNGFLFLTENGSIGPKVVRSALHDSFVPFNWIPKTYLPTIPIPPQVSSFVPVSEAISESVTSPVVAAEESVPPSIDNTSVQSVTPVIVVPSAVDNTSDQLNRIPLVAPVQYVSPTTVSHRTLPVPIAHRIAARLRKERMHQSTQLPSPVSNPAPQASISPTVPVPTRSSVRIQQRVLPVQQNSVPVTENSLVTPIAQPVLPASRSSARLRNTSTAFVSVVASDLVRPVTITRKLDNQRKATARNATHRRSLHVEHLNDRPSTIQPSPPPPVARAEVNIKQAIDLWGLDIVNAAIQKEVDKILVTYKSMRPITHNDIQADAVYLRSMVLLKMKSDGTVTARIPIDGSHQPTDSYGDTFAATTDITDRLFLLSVVLKDAADRNCLNQLEFLSGDIPAAFINGNKLSQGVTGDRQFITRFPLDFPITSLAGQYMEVTGAQYGMKQANNIYDEDLNSTMLSNTGYTSSPLYPRIYIKRNVVDSTKYSLVIFYTDDFEHFGTCPILKQQFVDLMTARYGSAMKFASPSVGTTGLQYVRHSNHSVTVTITKYILKLLTKAGMDSVEAALSPSLPSLFHIDSSSPLLDQAMSAHFRTINGGLVWILPVRFDVCKEVRWLCTRNKAPTVQDRQKQIHLLRYLKGVPDIGPTFNGSTIDAPGIRIEGASDVGHCVHPDSGASQIAFQVSIGESNAPFKVGCFAETGLISPDPTSAEYNGLGCVTKEILYWRQVADSLGFPQTEPSIIRQDNNSAINLTLAPQVTRRMRFTAVRHHHVRSAYKMKLIRPVYTNTNSIGCVDMHTKSTTVANPNQFLYNRSVLFNDRAKVY